METKERILVLLRYLRENTDEEKAVSAAELRAMFRERGESVSAPTLRDDIGALRKAGYEIDVREMNGIATYYKYLDREWTVPELQILIDAVASGQFISQKKSRELIERLKKMAGPSDRDCLEPGIRVDKRVKAPNEQILYIIQSIKEAIRQDSRIRFRYYEYDESLRRVQKHDGQNYTVSPYALIWKRDRYYLIGWSESHGQAVHFRIDRMGMPKPAGGPRVPMPKDLKLEDRSNRIFSMFDGPAEKVTLRFSPSVLNQIVDQFGTDINLKKAGDALETTATVHLSPTFYGWLFQYVGEMTVTAPEYVCRQYAERMKAGLAETRGNGR